jgi:hypothetical protein
LSRNERCSRLYSLVPDFITLSQQGEFLEPSAAPMALDTVVDRIIGQHTDLAVHLAVTRHGHACILLTSLGRYARQRTHAPSLGQYSRRVAVAARTARAGGAMTSAYAPSRASSPNAASKAVPRRTLVSSLNRRRAPRRSGRPGHGMARQRAFRIALTVRKVRCNAVKSSGICRPPHTVRIRAMTRKSAAIIHGP